MKPSRFPALTTTTATISTSTFSRSRSYCLCYRVCLLITILVQTGGKFCEGVNGASFGLVRIASVNSLVHDSTLSLSTEASTNSLAQSWFESPSTAKNSVRDSILREVLRDSKEILKALSESESRNKPQGYRYDYDYGDPFDPSFCDATGDFKEEDDSTTTVGPPEDENGDPLPFPGKPDPPELTTTPDDIELPMIPEGCYYFTGNETYLVCNDETMSEIPTDIPSGLDIFEMSATSVKCIRPHAFSNVHVVWLNLKENIIQSVAPEAFANVTGLKHLTMNYNQLKVPIWFRVHAGLDSLEGIELDHNDICMGNLLRHGGSSERPPPPDFGIQGPFLTSVRYISLRANPIEFIPSYFFARFSGTERVDKIDLSASRLTYIDADAFKPFKSIALVDLSENHGLMDVDELSKAATGLAASNIEQLILSYNTLYRVPKEALQIMSGTLTTLELRGNNFLQLSDDSFPHMFKLTSLNLDACKISRISPDAFDTLPNLEILSLRGNELTSVPAALASLRNLGILSLSDNKDDRGLAFQVGNQAFLSQSRLHTLYLNNVRLNRLNSSTFEGLTRLQNLSLENAYLDSVEDGTFLHTPQLTCLNVGSNPLNSSKLTPEASQGLQNLKTLILSNCGLTFTQYKYKDRAEHFDTPFRYLRALEHLDLSSNQITQLYPELFGNLIQLRQLDLNKNKIQPWGQRIFESNPYLEELHLAENQLVTVSRRMLKDFRTISEKVDLSENPFTCDTGICALKAAVENGSLPLHNWNVTPPVAYRCHRPDKPQTRVPIKSLTEEDCPGPGNGEGDGEETSTRSSTETTGDEGIRAEDDDEVAAVLSPATIFVVAACLIVVAACGVVAYRRRAQLHYTWLNLKGKLGKRKPGESSLLRKKKTSASEADAASEFEYDVFISYSHHDSEFIQDQLVPILEGKGRLLLNDDQQRREEHANSLTNGANLWDPTFKVCLHERDFEVGMSITENIIDSVDRSRKVVIVVSRNYLESQWCLFEMNLAYHRLVEVRRSCFLLILLEDIRAESRTKVLNYLMKSTTYLRWPSAGDGQRSAGASAPATASEKTLFWTRLRHALLKPSGTNP